MATEPCPGRTIDGIVSEVRKKGDCIPLNTGPNACRPWCVVSGKYEEWHVADVCTHCPFKRALDCPHLVTASRTPLSPCKSKLIWESATSKQGTTDV